MIKLKNFGLLEILVSVSTVYIITMLIWTATTRDEVLEKANSIKSNHTKVIDLLNTQVNKCMQACYLVKVLLCEVGH